MIPRSSLLLASLLALASTGLAADPVVNTLLPLKPEVRKIMDQSCVFCHGATHNGQKETRDDVDLSSDETIRATVANAGKMKYVLQNDKMPHKVRLSKRLRDDPKLQEELAALRANYDASGSKAVLLAWLKDVTAATEEEMKKEH
jgi:hypothetical protein